MTTYHYTCLTRQFFEMIDTYTKNLGTCVNEMTDIQRLSNTTLSFKHTNTATHTHTFPFSFKILGRSDINEPYAIEHRGEQPHNGGAVDMNFCFVYPPLR